MKTQQVKKDEQVFSGDSILSIDEHRALAKKVEEARLLLEEITETVRQHSYSTYSHIGYHAWQLSFALYSLRSGLNNEAMDHGYGEIYMPRDARAS